MQCLKGKLGSHGRLPVANPTGNAYKDRESGLMFLEHTGSSGSPSSLCSVYYPLDMKCLPRRFMCLNTWSLAGDTILGGFGMVMR